MATQPSWWCGAWHSLLSSSYEELTKQTARFLLLFLISYRLPYNEYQIAVLCNIWHLIFFFCIKKRGIESREPLLFAFFPVFKKKRLQYVTYLAACRVCCYGTVLSKACSLNRLCFQLQKHEGKKAIYKNMH